MEPDHPASTLMPRSGSSQYRMTPACLTGMRSRGSFLCWHPLLACESGRRWQRQTPEGEQQGCKEQVSRHSCALPLPGLVPYRATSQRPCRFRFRAVQTESRQKQGQTGCDLQHRFARFECGLASRHSSIPACSWHQLRPWTQLLQVASRAFRHRPAPSEGWHPLQREP